MENLKVTDNQQKHRFEADLGNGLALIEYFWENDIMVLKHTYVPDSHRGQGIAGQMIKMVLDYLKEQKIRIRVTCPVITAYIARHAGYQSLLHH